MLALSGCVVDSEPRDPPAAGGTPSPSTTATDSPGETSTASPSETTDSLGDDGAYVDRDGFSIVFPPTWEVRADVAGLQVAGFPPEQLAPDFADNVGVIFEDTGDPNITAEEYLDASARNAPSLMDDFDLVETVVIDDAATLEYTGSFTRPLHFLALIRVKDGKAFTATFTATPETYEVGLSVAREILESLRVT